MFYSLSDQKTSCHTQRHSFITRSETDAGQTSPAAAGVTVDFDDRKGVRSPHANDRGHSDSQQPAQCHLSFPGTVERRKVPPRCVWLSCSSVLIFPLPTLLHWAVRGTQSRGIFRLRHQFKITTGIGYYLHHSDSLALAPVRSVSVRSHKVPRCEEFS